VSRPRPRSVPVLAVAALLAACGPDAAPSHPRSPARANGPASRPPGAAAVDADPGIIIETRPIDEQESIAAGPIVKDGRIDDGHGPGDAAEVEASLGDPRFDSDTPFQGQGANADIGVGFGGGHASRRRVGGRRNLRADGGGGFGLPLAQRERSRTDSFAPVDEAGFRIAATSPLSTFGADVDTASYSVVRRHLLDGSLPPAGSVRLEEMVNYFPYTLPSPDGPAPFSVTVDGAGCPWQPRHRLVRIALQARRVPDSERPAANLVFLVDVSGSMQSEDRLPLLARSLRLLAERLKATDRVSIVVYAGASGLALPTTPGGDAAIAAVLDRLRAGGSTNGAEGIRLAYATARAARIEGGINRVILCTDGDFNVGTTSRDELVALVQEEAKAGVFLTVLGFGLGNLKDDTMEALADKGNGNYAYIDTIEEGRKVLVDQVGGTLQAVAKDVKVQVEFNPERVAGWRLLGYENRALAAEDFKDDRKDAGDIGAGHSVTALYEIVPAAEPVPAAGVDELKYRAPAATTGSAESLTVRLRWKEPDGDESRPLEVPFTDAGRSWTEAGEDFRFASAVACFAMVLRASPHAGSASFDTARELAAGLPGSDPGGHRAEFLRLVERAAGLKEAAKR
jgi:Ca-activated chloride channel family protein